MDDGEEVIEDARLRSQLKRQAFGIALKAALAAVVATAVVVALP